MHIGARKDHLCQYKYEKKSAPSPNGRHSDHSLEAREQELLEQVGQIAGRYLGGAFVVLERHICGFEKHNKNHNIFSSISTFLYSMFGLCCTHARDGFRQ